MPGPIYACQSDDTARQYIDIHNRHTQIDSKYMKVIFKIRLDKTGILNNKQFIRDVCLVLDNDTNSKRNANDLEVFFYSPMFILNNYTEIHNKNTNYAEVTFEV